MPKPLTHDAAIRQLQALGRTADREAIIGAFVASLGQPPGFWRAPLCALAAATTVPTHRYRAFSTRRDSNCAECGMPQTVEFEEPHEKGQVIPGDLPTAIVLLTRAAKERAPVAMKVDAERLAKILAIVRTLPASARESKLTTELRKRKLVLGDRYDVRSVVETLGACGLLQTPEHPGLATKWTSFAARQDRPSSNIETDPPIAFWTAAHGVDAAQTKAWFGALGVAAGVKPRAVPVAAASKSAAAREKRAARSTELEVGDVVAIAKGRRWYVAIVVDHFKDKGGRRPIVEVVDWSGVAMPTIEQVRKAKAIGAKVGTKRLRDPISIDLWTREDPKGRWKTLEGTLPAPASQHLGAPLGICAVVSLGRDGAGLDRLVREVK